MTPDRPSPSDLQRQLRRFKFAVSDMRQARAAASLLAEGGGRAADTDRALETAIVVCCARPFTSNQIGALDRNRWKPDGEQLAAPALGCSVL